MSYFRPLTALLCLSSTWALSQSRANVEFRSLPPSNEWRVEGAPMQLSSPEPGILKIGYEAKITESFTVGHMTFKQVTSRILLKDPIAMGKDLRVLFEARGIERERNRSGKRQVLPLVRDKKGEVFICEPFSYPHLKTGTTQWGLWMTSYLHAGEAGGPTQNVYQSDGAGDGWPEEPLEFIGFEVQIRGELNETVRGEFALGEVAFAGLILPKLPPFFYADAILDQEKGDYTFQAEAATEFQAEPRYATEKKIRYDGSSLNSRRQKLLFPTGPESDFWSTYRLRDGSGSILKTEPLTYRLDPGSENAETITPKAQQQPLQILTKGIIPGVMPAGEKWGVTAAITNLPGKGTTLLKWELLPASFPEPLAKGEVSIKSLPAKQWIELPELPGRDAYRVRMELLHDGKVMDTSLTYLGRPTDFAHAYEGRKGQARLRDEVKSAAYFRTTFRPTKGLTDEDAVMDEYRQHLKEASQMARDVTIMVDTAEFEVLPGVYDFSLLDRMMDASADYGAGVTLRLAHSDAYSTYHWPKLERQRNFDGSEIYHHFYGNYSPHDPEHIALWKRANRALYDRYKTHPAFQGYYIMQPAGESVVLDQPWLANIAGYSKGARIAFQRYLKGNKQLTLEALNQRWGTTYGSWEEVTVPMPDFELKAKPDLRPQWLDFQEFKEWVDKVGWFLELAKDVRTYDKDRIIIVYAWELEPLKDLVDYSHGGGVPESPGRGEGEKFWRENRIGAIQESIHPHRWGESGDPGDLGWLLDWNLYTMFSRAGGGGVNIHIYYYPIEEMVKKYGGVYAFDRYQKFKPILSELHDARLVTPLHQEVAVLQESLTLHAKHRTIFGHRMSDLRRWFDILTASGIEFESYRASELNHYRLILPNLLEEVMPKQSIDMLAEFVKKGGKTIIAANTGRYDDETGAEPFPLLRALGIEPPTGSYDTKGEDISAIFAKGASPLTKGIGTLKFYSTEEQKKEARLPWKFEDFKQWPYRWISESDYFGRYPGQTGAGGKILAKFSDGGAAITLHEVGKGQVAVFWGTPDYRDPALETLLKNAVVWAGVSDKSSENPIPLMMEATNEKLQRHYVILWESRPGTYTQKFPFAPDGKFLVEDLISEQRLGIHEGKELREKGLPLKFEFGYSPLKVLRLRADIPGFIERYYQTKEEPKTP